MNVRNQQPFPDMRDPVTGEWLPSSYTSEKQFKRVQAAQKVSQADYANYANMLLSVLK